jgi:hypothetical protein
MADIGVAYTLTTPGGTILFNNTGEDDFNDPGSNEFYITEADGLDGTRIRAPIDPAPQADGAILHNFWKGERNITITGALIIRTTRVMDSIVAARNVMEASLLAALESILQADGTLAWTPQGQAARSLTVRHHGAPPLEFSGIELKTFVFGLVAANPDW